MRLLHSLALVLITLSLASPALAAPKPCSVLRGVNRFEEPLIRTPEMAKAMFLAIEKEVNSGSDPKRFPLVEVGEDEDYWWVARLPLQQTPPIEGGGQLKLKIAKCDAAIAGVFLSR